MLQNEAGSGMDPPGSVPTAIGTDRAPTVLALPPDDPPGTPSRSHGLRVGKNAEFSQDEPIANSSILVLPTITASAASSRCTTVDEYGGLKFARIFEPHVVSSPLRQKMSLTAVGTPAKGPTASPRAMRASTSRAFASARSGSSVMYALSDGSTRSIDANAAFVTSSALRSRRAIASRIS